ncbi:MAG: efflux RND transporter periplasmic adaptor subunit [bacterium]|nr:efflux RND transporter periplasmic adaptor subunit [bacterium]
MWKRFQNVILLLLSGGLLVQSCGGGEVLNLAGSVERKALDLAAPVSEVIVELPRAVGERVEAGHPVVRLDSEVATAELRAYEAALTAAQAMQKEAESELERIDDLRRARVKTPQDLDKARRQRDEAVALVAEKEARITQAKQRLEDLTITSHAAGVVDQLPYEVGERVPAGGSVAVVLAEEEPWVRVWLPARAVARVAPATEVDVRVEGMARRMRGRIEDVSREPEFTPHYALTARESAHLVYATRIVLANAPEDLRSGLPVQVRVVLPPEGKGSR